MLNNWKLPGEPDVWHGVMSLQCSKDMGVYHLLYMNIVSPEKSWKDTVTQESQTEPEDISHLWFLKLLLQKNGSEVRDYKFLNIFADMIYLTHASRCCCFQTSWILYFKFFFSQKSSQISVTFQISTLCTFFKNHRILLDSIWP